MPVFEPASPDEVSLDEISKAVQRMKSVGAMTPKLLERFYTQLGADIEGIEDLNFDDGDTSRGGESNGTSGTGNSQSGGANSATNSENSVDRSVKQFVHDGDLIIDTNTDKPINLMDVNPETGEYNSVH